MTAPRNAHRPALWGALAALALVAPLAAAPARAADPAHSGFTPITAEAQDGSPCMSNTTAPSRGRDGSPCSPG